MVVPPLDPDEMVEEEAAEWTPSSFPFLQQRLLVAVVDVNCTWMWYVHHFHEVLVVSWEIWTCFVLPVFAAMVQELWLSFELVLLEPWSVEHNWQF